MFVLLFIASIIAAIMLHEAGHFATAKLFGMKAERFFLGFGPTLWSTQRGETEYGVKAIPAGGFVKIVGMTPWEPTDPADDGRLFHQQPAWQRAIVLVAGSVTHVVLAVVLLFSALAFVGLPGDPTTAIEAVAPDSPASAAGLQPGDEVVAIDGQATASFEQVRAAVEPRAGQEVNLEVLRDGERVTLTAVLDVPHPTEEGAGYLGVVPRRPPEPLGVGEGLRETFTGDLSIGRLTSLTVDGLLQVFSPSALSEFFGSVSDEGPRDPETITSLVGVGQAVNALGGQGDVFAVLAVLAQLNVVLALLNMLPLPPLDGGHLAVLVVEESVDRVRRIRGRPESKWRINPAVITPVALLVIAFFVVLSVTAIYVDITRPISDLLQ